MSERILIGLRSGEGSYTDPFQPGGAKSIHNKEVAEFVLTAHVNRFLHGKNSALIQVQPNSKQHKEWMAAKMEMDKNIEAKSEGINEAKSNADTNEKKVFQLRAKKAELEAKKLEKEIKALEEEEANGAADDSEQTGEGGGTEESGAKKDDKSQGGGK